MFDRLKSPDDAFEHKLGATLKMEQESLKILDANIKSAQDDDVRELFEHHREETEGHVKNVEEAFEALGWDPSTSACPAIEGLRVEGKANAGMSDDSIVDSILLQGSVEVEHHEVGVYENLLINARAMERDDVVTILERNFDEEKHTLTEVKEMQRKVARVTPKEPA